MVKKYVLTGGPCSGKTTTVNYLRDQGHSVLVEAAGVVIAEQQTQGGNLLPWTDRDGFQKEVLRVQIEELVTLDSALERIFCDRSIIDGIAYYILDGLEVPAEMVEAAKEHRYDKIFLLAQLPDFVQDSVRREDAETGEKVSQIMRETYERNGYEVIVVPVMSVEERAKFILERV